MRSETEVAPLPWRIEVVDGECWGIIDADGDNVVITDSAVYPPNMATAEFIVSCVNKAMK